MSKKLTTKEIVIIGILMALTTIFTIAIQIPSFSGHGYLNMGDAVVLFTALYLGKKFGGIVGGVGSALADIFTGYMVYAPITLIVKGLEGYICGMIAEKGDSNKYKVLATVSGGIIMVLGYYIGEIILYGVKGSLASIPGNTMQASFGVILALMVYTPVKNILKK